MEIIVSLVSSENLFINITKYDEEKRRIFEWIKNKDIIINELENDNKNLIKKKYGINQWKWNNETRIWK